MYNTLSTLNHHPYFDENLKSAFKQLIQQITHRINVVLYGLCHIDSMSKKVLEKFDNDPNTEMNEKRLNFLLSEAEKFKVSADELFEQIKEARQLLLKLMSDGFTNFDAVHEFSLDRQGLNEIQTKVSEKLKNGK